MKKTPNAKFGTKKKSFSSPASKHHRTEDSSRKPKTSGRSAKAGATAPYAAKGERRFAAPSPAAGRGREDDAPRNPRASGKYAKHGRPSASSAAAPDRGERRFGSPRTGGAKPAATKKSSGAPRPAGKHTSMDKEGKLHIRRESLQRKGVLLWGIHAVRHAWLNPKRICYRLWMTEAGHAALGDMFEQGHAQSLSRPDPLHASKSEIEHFLPSGTVHQGVVLEVAALPERSLDDVLGKDNAPEIVVILDQVTDPHNVGAIMRSAAAFGAGAVIVTERNAPGLTGIIAKTACGAMEHVPLIAVVNIARTLETLQQENYWCVGLAEEGPAPLSACKMETGKIALVLGAEGDGLRRLTREHCDELAHLPTQGPIGSLNVSNAAATSLYEVRRQRLKISTN